MKYYSYVAFIAIIFFNETFHSCFFIFFCSIVFSSRTLKDKPKNLKRKRKKSKQCDNFTLMFTLIASLFINDVYMNRNLLDRTQKRKIEREEERLKSTNRDLMMVKMKSMFAIGFAFTSLLSMFNSIFDGKVVAKLPFTPITWLQGLSHRNLLGDDFTDCSFIFLYILCTMR